MLISLLLMFICTKGEAQDTITATNHASCTEDKNMITGKTTLEQLSQNEEFWSEYLTNYASCIIEKEKIEEISILLKDRVINIVVVLGTWCGDTKEQFPVLQKILDNLQGSHISIEYIGVNRDKLAGETDISSLGIMFVPTFIFYESNRELGRIVEIPEGTMSENIHKIIRNKQ
jgi:thiol-disulfide isomerase/thioredoxin